MTAYRPISTLSLLAALLLVPSCTSDTPDPTTMDKEKIKTEVLAREKELLDLLRSGRLMDGVAIHLDSPDYRNIWNGESKTHAMLRERIKAGMANGLKSFDYQVRDREFLFIDDANTLETLTAMETDHMADGSSVTSGLTTISILWRKVDGQWWVGWLHASELPKGA
jgi:hypothetical protein